jgi:manganese oxidase
VKVRDEPSAADVRGWYAHPAGSVAQRAEPARMAEDGIEV